MKTLPTLLAVSLALALAPALAVAQHDHAAHAAHAAQDDHAGHDGHAADADHAAHPALAEPAAVPADHVPWTPDAPLVEGMSRVREAMAGLAHHEMGHLGESTVVVLAEDIDAAIEYMFANCKLAPEPDVALHGVLARLMAGSKALHADPADPSPVAGMRAAVEDYGRLFDDPAAPDADADAE